MTRDHDLGHDPVVHQAEAYAQAMMRASIDDILQGITIPFTVFDQEALFENMQVMGKKLAMAAKMNIAIKAFSMQALFSEEICTHESFLAAWVKLCDLHPMLRLQRMWSDRATGKAVVGPVPRPEDLPIVFFDNATVEASWESFIRRGAMFWKCRDDFPWEIELYQIASDPELAIMVMHNSHAFNDGISKLALMRELTMLLSGVEVERVEFSLPAPLEQRRPDLRLSSMSKAEEDMLMEGIGEALELNERTSKSIIISEKLDKVSTMTLVAACKREHVTVTDAITAALLMAMPSENVEVVQAVCMREPREPIQLNLDITPAILPLVDVKGLQLWDAARKCHTAMHMCLDNNECRSVCTRNLLRAYSSKCGTQRVPLKDRDLHTLFVSSMGDLDRRLNAPGAAPGSCRWGDLAVVSSNPSIAWATFVWAGTSGGCLRMSVTDMDAPTDPQEIRDLVDNTFKLLRAL
eukprot:m51a1_g2539 hypothetical protein (465) ;mRNA; r:259338-265916